jgi:hypothetical protein
MRWLTFAVLGLVLCAVALVTIVRAGDEPPRGLRIDGQAIDPDQPLAAQLTARAKVYGEELVVVRTGPFKTQRMRRELGASLDVAEATARAREVGRSGRLIADLRKWLSARRGRLDLPWPPAIDEQKLGAFVARERDRLELPPKVGVSDGHGWSLPGEAGVTLDYHQAMATLTRALKAGRAEVELALRAVPPPEPIVIGLPDGALFDESDPDADAEAARAAQGPLIDTVPAAVVAGIEWLPSRGRECYARPPMPDFCEGPRMVPRPVGRAALLAGELGLGGLHAVRRVLMHGADPRWIAAAGGPRLHAPLLWPVPGGRFGRGFGFVRKRIEIRHQLHKGVDIPAPLGSAIRATSAAIAVYSDNGIRGYGNLLILAHADGSVTFTAHCRRIFVAPGQRVNAGQIVAEIGVTGMTMGPHLHFEYHRAGRPTDPMPLFADAPRR